MGFATGRYVLENAPGSHGLLILRILSPEVGGDLEYALVMMGIYSINENHPSSKSRRITANPFNVI